MCDTNDFHSALYLLILKLKLELHVDAMINRLVVLGSGQWIGSGGIRRLRRIASAPILPEQIQTMISIDNFYLKHLSKSLIENIKENIPNIYKP